MDKFIVTGGTRLHGAVKVCGAKNAILPILAASLLSSGTCVIHNVPLLQDVVVMTDVLKCFGARIKWENKALIIDAKDVHPAEIPEETVKKMRASNLVLGPLLARFGYVKIPYPGGCAIGSRPMDYHVKGLQQLGADIQDGYGFIEAKSEGLMGSEIYLDFPSVGATENILMAAAMAKGVSVLRNAAREPEIVDLARFLNRMGAKIDGAGTDIIQITGVNCLGSVEHTVIPDRIVAGTFLLAAAITGGDITLINAVVDHLEPLIAKLREAGVSITKNGRGIRIKGNKGLRAVDIKTMPFPGFPTDIQPQMMALMTVARGTAVFAENIFENRFKHADELRRMGADIKVAGRIAIVKGVEKLTGAVVEASDLRAGAALVLAGLAADGVTVVENIFHIDRGYFRMEEKYAVLGANIIRVTKHNSNPYQFENFTSQREIQFPEKKRLSLIKIN
ncbi:MAG: UDP-N-acetylglucosamine 1-carboxyvinyltransferase [Desulfitobacteriaceae bacterium]|nr:UDP-N-acetylglucosamine 1-carboxyvinyltransferase [Desulfitobacteriaceae bacterium]MDD4752679.1 UDP-N-acetylglucosamine 1-carboxyvinyltransferase [Desulfitobacteriaceae bacterium]